MWHLVHCVGLWSPCIGASLDARAVAREDISVSITTLSMVNEYQYSRAGSARLPSAIPATEETKRDLVLDKKVTLGTY